MQQFRDVVLSPSGRPIPGATVTVTIAAGGTPTLYSDNGSTALGSNVITTDANGEYKFYAINRRYTLTITATGYTSTTRDVVLFDPQELFFSFKSFGAKGDNSTNDTVPMQACLDAAAAVNGFVIIDAGEFRNSGLTISAPMTIKGYGKRTSWLRMIGLSNANCLTVAVGIDEGLVLENFGIDGVRSANTSGHGIHFPIDTVNSYGHSAIMNHLYITQCADDGVRVDGNRNNGRGNDVTVTRCTNGIRIEASSDWRWGQCGVGVHDERALYVVSGADNCFESSSFFMSIGTAAVTLAGTSSSPTKIKGCTINGNERDGLEIVGPSGIARHIAHVIEGNWFETNGLAANDTYADITCTDVSGVIFANNSFRQLGSGNIPKYLIRFGGATAAVQWVGNSVPTSPAPYATALTNTDFRLYLDLQGLNLNGQITNDPAYYVNASNDAAAAAAGVPVGRHYRNGSVQMIRVS